RMGHHTRDVAFEAFRAIGRNRTSRGKTMTTCLLALLLNAAVIRSTIKVRFDLRDSLASTVTHPALVGVTVVKPDQTADLTVHVALRDDSAGGLAMDMWLTPGISESNKATVYCNRNPDCHKRAADDPK